MDQTPSDHQFSARNGLTFTYRIRWSGQTANSRPILVQCPGWGLGSRYLESGLSPLEAHFKLIYFHPRGSAGSSRPVDSAQMSCFDMAADLELFRIHLGMDQYPAMLGHSHGGAIVLAYAQTYPERVARIILIDHRLMGLGDTVVKNQFKKERKGDARYHKAYEKLRTSNPTSDIEFTEYIRAVAPIYFYAPEKHVPTYLAALDRTVVDLWCHEKVAVADMIVKRRKKMLKDLKRVTAQTLIIFGKQDAQCTIGNLEQTKLGISHSKAIALEECGHFPWIEKPIETFTAIKEFLGEE
ncbi:hypothetical protein PRK78_002453 [Emydomyces testavorans]|uniref:AB hydrolase-1 domain-containing protein n=1 Tax=Emydomyces testavorans TaxID=2070801 RepID=A0AAF0DEC0_9EURO|nr:hypothetical protein PRK78_002453 [Emydomyces testavorans]